MLLGSFCYCTNCAYCPCTGVQASLWLRLKIKRGGIGRRALPVLRQRTLRPLRSFLYRSWNCWSLRSSDFSTELAGTARTAAHLVQARCFEGCSLTVFCIVLLFETCESERVTDHNKASATQHQHSPSKTAKHGSNTQKHNRSNQTHSTN